jgi:hypothetical protein
VCIIEKKNCYKIPHNYRKNSKFPPTIIDSKKQQSIRKEKNRLMAFINKNVIIAPEPTNKLT